MQNRLDNFVNTICADYYEKNKIDPALHKQYSVSRGLRNEDGSGVLAGLTRICSVQGAFMQDGERVPVDGKLFYRSYDINDLVNGFVEAKRFGYEETVYLILFGHLPDEKTLAEFTSLLRELYALPAGFTENMIIKAPSANVMNKLARSVLALYSYDPNPDDCTPENMLRQSLEMIARLPIIVSHAYAVKRHYFDQQSLILHRPEENLSIAENILHTLRPDSSYTAEEARVLDLCLVLHAEHGGGNNSAFAARVLASSGTDTYSALAAAMGSLKGPLHGGANEKVAQMFEMFKQNIKNWEDREEIAYAVAKTLDKQLGDGTGLIYGMGHAVYTLSDPRAVILRRLAEKMALKRGGDVAREFKLIDTIAEVTPPIYTLRHGDAKKIAANVDFYSGFVYRMCNIPEELFTPVFAVSRMAGWCAHRMEERLFGGRIIRPAYRSIVKPERYVPLGER